MSATNALVVICTSVLLLLCSPYGTIADCTDTVQDDPQLAYTVTTNRDTVTSLFQCFVVTVTIKNLENESVALDIGGYPGGRFFILKDDGTLINLFPRYFFTLYWGITLEPGEEYILYQGTWYQRNMLCLLARNGQYHIYGSTGIIYYQNHSITPEPFGPANVTIARRFIP